MTFIAPQLVFEEIDEEFGVKGAMLVAPDGKLGIDVLHGARVTIDYPNGVYRLER